MPGTPVVHWSTKTASLDNQSACICRGRGWLNDSRSESLMQVSTGSVWVGEVTLPEAEQEVNKHTEKLLYRTTSRATAI